MKGLQAEKPLKRFVNVRMTEDDYHLLVKSTDFLGVTPSKFIRYHLRRALAQADRQINAA